MPVRFADKFTVTGGPEFDGLFLTPEVLSQRCGITEFDRGLYRIHSKQSATEADALIHNYFPDFSQRSRCFAYDWMGCQFAIDSARGAKNDPEILMFEPGTGEVLEIPIALSRFHDEELVTQSEAALSQTFFHEWIESGGVTPTPNQCVGYKTPLFLGGEDDVPNLEISDLDVYWTLMGQLWCALQGGSLGGENC